MNNNSQKVMAYRRRKKIALVIAFGAKCQICGLEDEPYMYDFHHIDSTTKTFNLSQSNYNTSSKDKAATEAKKCAMLCANCHRKVENSTEDFYLTSSFQEQLFYDTIDKLVGRETLEEKAAKESQKQEFLKNLEAKQPNREELKSLIRKYPFTEVGSMFGMSDNGIRKWCIKFNLPSKKKEIKLLSDEEWELI